MGKVYKYFSYEVLELVFDREGFCGLKCSYPKDYNDPFELFLSLGSEVPSDVLAFYNDVVQEIPQYPTTCFSKSPVVTPMWAHYGGNQTGFVLEFDAEKLQEWNDEVKLKDVTYENKANDVIKNHLMRAAVTKKPRHSYFLKVAAENIAYFTKSEQWSYEQESRLVLSSDDVEVISGNQIFFIPDEIVSSIIVGPNFPFDKTEFSQELSKKHKMNWYKLTIGKSISIPYMKCIADNPYIFAKHSIVHTVCVCVSCGEPLSEDMDLCQWCRITENEKYAAAQSNPFRILEAYGRLEAYIKQADQVGKNNK